MVRHFVILFSILIAHSTFAQQDSTIVLGFGTFTDAIEFGDSKGPSRKVGGEKFVIKLRKPLTDFNLTIASYSASGSGKLLVRGAKIGDSKDMVEIAGFADKLLATTETLTADIAEPTRQIELQIEGMANNDASLQIVVDAGTSLGESDFMVSRTYPDHQGNYGTFVDESAYPEFTMAEYHTLLKSAHLIPKKQMDQTNWVCSSITTDGQKALDYKTQFFFMDGVFLKSTTTQIDQVGTWMETEEGLSFSGTKGTSCNVELVITSLVKGTPAGNLVKEHVFRRTDVYKACSHMTKKQVDPYFPAPSTINPESYFLIGHEFCRPTDLN